MSEPTKPIAIELPEPPEGCYIVFHPGMTDEQKKRAGKKTTNDYYWMPDCKVWESVWSMKPEFAEGVIYARRRI
jgi:hypothetical protein